MSAIKEYYFDLLTSDDCWDNDYQEIVRDRVREDREEAARILADRFGMNNEDWEV